MITLPRPLIIFATRAIVCVAVALTATMPVSGAVIDDARAAIDGGNYERALEMLAPLHRKTPRDAGVNLLLGQAYYGLGRNDEASASLAVAAKGGRYDAYPIMVNIALDNLDIDAADGVIDSWRAALRKSKREDSAALTAAESRVINLSNVLERVENVNTVARFTIPRATFRTMTADWQTGPANETFYTRRDSTGVYRLYSAGILDDGTLDSERELTQYVGNGNIVAPFMQDDGETLYFASDGELGGALGGFDLYMTRRDGEGGFYEPTNLGMPYNSTGNDYLFVIDENRGLGWWATDRADNDSIDIIVFRPAATRVNLPADVDNLIDKALARTVANPDASVTMPESLNPSNERLTATTQCADLVISMGDGRIIDNPDELTAPGAEDLWYDLVDLAANIDDINARLAQLRQTYRDGDRSVSGEIMALERNLEKIRAEYQTTLNRLIRAR